MRFFNICVVHVTLACAALTAGCSGSGDSPGSGTVTVAVTDLPVDASQIAAVCVAFNRITLHTSGDGAVTVPYNPAPEQVSSATHCLEMPPWDGTPPVPPVRLDALGGPVSVALTENVRVTEGRVNWIRLHLVPGESYIEDTSGVAHTLICPSCEATENNEEKAFKLNRSFAVADGAHVAMTVDVDLRKSLTLEGGSDTYVLRPTARMEEDTTVGTIEGEVSEETINAHGGSPYIGIDVDTGCAAYVYAGENVTPDDYYLGSPVLNTASVRFDLGSGVYRFAVGGLVGGTEAAPNPYTVAVTCDLDNPEVDESLSFTAGVNVGIVAGRSTSLPTAF